VPTRNALMLNVFGLLIVILGTTALLGSPMEVRSMVLPWPVLRGLLVFAAAANLGSIVMLAVRALRTSSQLDAPSVQPS
jgi:protein-S-isoprenylcysteine O-methyltransferase Ste14